MRAAAEKEERIELLRRQSVRRLLNAALADGWSAWVELWAARTDAKRKLRLAARSFRSPGISDAFDVWVAIVAALQQRQRLREERRRSLGLEGKALTLSEQMQRKCAEYERRLQAAEFDKESALKRQLVELTGTADEVMAMRAGIAEDTQRPSSRHAAAAKSIALRSTSWTVTGPWWHGAGLSVTTRYMSETERLPSPHAHTRD